MVKGCFLKIDCSDATVKSIKKIYMLSQQNSICCILLGKGSSQVHGMHNCSTLYFVCVITVRTLYLLFVDSDVWRDDVMKAEYCRMGMALGYTTPCSKNSRVWRVSQCNSKYE